MNKESLGGTELMYHELMRRLPQEYKDKFSIFNYTVYADETKKLIYWNQLSYDQPAVQFLNDADSVNKIDHFVFVSHWQSEMFRKRFNIPGYKTSVIKNAHLGVYPRSEEKAEKVRICYTSTPWRGLEILLNSWELLNTDDAELHIFSGCGIYGEEFAKETDSQYQHLYDKCQELSNVVYHGNVPNEQLRHELSTFDILAYPNTFEETSCIAVIEALASGLRVVTSNIGALPETTEGWARMYPYLANPQLHTQVFANILREEIDNIKSGSIPDVLLMQRDIYSSRWDWNYRYPEWLQLLDNL